jgi:hypothetical protein
MRLGTLSRYSGSCCCRSAAFWARRAVSPVSYSSSRALKVAPIPATPSSAARERWALQTREEDVELATSRSPACRCSNGILRCRNGGPYDRSDTPKSTKATIRAASATQCIACDHQDVALLGANLRSGRVQGHAWRAPSHAKEPRSDFPSGGYPELGQSTRLFCGLSRIARVPTTCWQAISPRLMSSSDHSVLRGDSQ